MEILPAEDGSTWLYLRPPCPVAVTLATFSFDAMDLYQRVDTSHDRRTPPRESGTGGTPLGDAAAHVREEMQRLELPFDEAVWDAGAKAHRLWTQPLTAP